MDVDTLDDQARGLRMVARTANPRIVSVVSGKGGVGKTFVSTSLALCAAKQGQRVLLIDGDLSLANVDVALGLRCRHNLADVINGKVSFHEALAPGPEGIFLLPATSGVADLAQIDDALQQRILAVLQPQLGAFDLVVIDCGAGVGSNVVFFGRAAEDSLLVLTPEPTSLSDAYATIKVLHRSAGIDVIDVVVNQARDSVARDVFRRLSTVVGQFLSVRLRFKASIPLDDGVRQAIIARRPLVLSQAGAPASMAMMLLSKAMMLEARPLRPGLLKAPW